MGVRSILFASTMCLSSAALGQAAAPMDAATAFGAREAIGQASLSPDGTKVAFVGRDRAHGSVVFVFDAKAGAAPRAILSATGEPEQINRCMWITNDRLTCTIVGKIGAGQNVGGFSRIIVLDADGKNTSQLSTRKGESARNRFLWGGQIIERPAPGSDEILIMRNHSYGSPTVERVNINSLTSKIVETGPQYANDFISDGLGNVRIMGVYKFGAGNQYTGQTSYLFRPKGRREWQSLGIFDSYRLEGFNPYSIDPVQDVAYGFGKVNGRLALVSRSLGPDESYKIVAARRDVDVDGMLRIGPRGRLVGATFATERRESVYFDKDLAAIAVKLGRALPQTPLIQFVDSSADENALLIWAGSDTNPGQYYLFDKISKKLSPLVPTRPQLSAINLASVKSVTYTAADGTKIPAYLTLPAGATAKHLPTVVIPHGGVSSRDEWGFDWIAQFFASQGYAVLQPNFRGSFGYGDAWYLKSGLRAWDVAIPDIIDGGKWLVKEGIADPDRMFAFGFGYGGYAVLQSAVVEPGFFKAVAAVGAVTDLEKLRHRVRNVNMDYAADDYLGDAAHVAAGSPLRHAAKIKAPVLLFHGALDTQFSIEHSRDLADKLRSSGRLVTLIEYPKLDESLDDSLARAEVLAKSADLFGHPTR